MGTIRTDVLELESMPFFNFVDSEALNKADKLDEKEYLKLEDRFELEAFKRQVELHPEVLTAENMTLIFKYVLLYYRAGYAELEKAKSTFTDFQTLVDQQQEHLDKLTNTENTETLQKEVDRLRSSCKWIEDQHDKMVRWNWIISGLAALFLLL
jgi:hypothetical protein